MTGVLQHLIDLLSLEKKSHDTFVGLSEDLGLPAIFGGQVLGQSLVAAWETVDNWLPHSLHAYFLRPGDAQKPIEYRVDRIRDGGSFCTRYVTACQNGQVIFNLSSSFKSKEEGLQHQDSAPSVPGPEGLLSEQDIAKQYADRLPEKMRLKFTQQRPIEVRVIDPVDPFNPHRRPATKYSWFKAIDKLPNDPKIHYALLAYASDFGLALTSLLPHGQSFIDKNMHVTSIDHAIWFHQEFHLDQWLLYSKDSPSAANGLGFNRGQVYSQDGRLVASVSQESLIRKRKPK
ncbi:MAG: acyl-CoA thioesterase II [Bdellovibrionota bacterium]